MKEGTTKGGGMEKQEIPQEWRRWRSALQHLALKCIRAGIDPITPQAPPNYVENVLVNNVCSRLRRLDNSAHSLYLASEYMKAGWRKELIDAGYEPDETTIDDDPLFRQALGGGYVKRDGK